MQEFAYYGSSLLRSFFEFACMFLMLNSLFSLRNASHRRFALFFMLYLIIDGLCAFADIAEINPFIDLLVFLIRYVKAIPLFFFMFEKISKRMVVYLYITYAIMISIITQTILFASRIYVTYSDSMTLLNFIDSAVSIILFIFLLIVRNSAALKNTIRNFTFIRPRTFILLVFTLVCVAILENNIFSQYMDSTFTTSMTKMLSVSLLILLIALIIYLMFINSSKIISENIVTNLSTQIDTQISHYETLKSYDDEMRKFRHDYKNMILCLKALLQANETADALSFINDLEGSFDHEKPLFDSGNYIADALLSTKSRVSLEHNTEIDFDGFIPSSRVTNLDLCIILSNALDNAIEACLAIEGKKMISLFSETKNGFWFISIENPVTNDINIKNNTIFTSKRDPSRHGYGLQNIERTVKKNSGKMKISCENKKFTLDVAVKLRPSNTEIS